VAKASLWGRPGPPAIMAYGGSGVARQVAGTLGAGRGCRTVDAGAFSDRDVVSTPALRREQIKLELALIHALTHTKGHAAPDRRRNRAEFREFLSIQGIPGALLMAPGDHA
jgi:hypothetical protein